MQKKRFKDGFKTIYALSLVGQLGFYIAIPFLAAIMGHNYMDKYILNGYLRPQHETAHLMLDFGLAILVGVFSIWQIYKLMKPFLDNK